MRWPGATNKFFWDTTSILTISVTNGRGTAPRLCYPKWGGGIAV
jgi:hypothetical protein